MINSEYVSYAAYQKNCYLVFFSDYAENVLYSDFLAHVKDTMDSYRIKECELGYSNVGMYKCYNAFFLKNVILVMIFIFVEIVLAAQIVSAVPIFVKNPTISGTFLIAKKNIMRNYWKLISAHIR